jgi:hypothetical protein
VPSTICYKFCQPHFFFSINLEISLSQRKLFCLTNYWLLFASSFLRKLLTNFNVVGLGLTSKFKGLKSNWNPNTDFWCFKIEINLKTCQSIRNLMMSSAKYTFKFVRKHILHSFCNFVPTL